MSFKATGRLNSRSIALYTAPIPPSPSICRISYRPPSTSPACSTGALGGRTTTGPLGRTGGPVLTYDAVASNMVASGSRWDMGESILGKSLLGKSTPGTSTMVASDSKGGLEPALSPFAGTLTPGEPAALLRFRGSIREFGLGMVRLLGP